MSKDRINVELRDVTQYFSVGLFQLFCINYLEEQNKSIEQQVVLLRQRIDQLNDQITEAVERRRTLEDRLVRNGKADIIRYFPVLSSENRGRTTEVPCVTQFHSSTESKHRQSVDSPQSEDNPYFSKSQTVELCTSDVAAFLLVLYRQSFQISELQKEKENRVPYYNFLKEQVAFWQDVLDHNNWRMDTLQKLESQYDERGGRIAKKRNRTKYPAGEYFVSSGSRTSASSLIPQQEMLSSAQVKGIEVAAHSEVADDLSTEVRKIKSPTPSRPGSPCSFQIRLEIERQRDAGTKTPPPRN